MAENQKECRKEAERIVEVLNQIVEDLDTLQSDEEILCDAVPEGLRQNKEDLLYVDMLDYINQARGYVYDAIDQLKKMNEKYLDN